MKQAKLNITFHNPNPSETTARMIVKLAAEAVKIKVTAMIQSKRTIT